MKRPYFFGLSLDQKLDVGIEVAGDHECWLWLGTRSDSGYPLVSHKEKTSVVTRLVLAKKLGRDLRPGEMACHHCDNPPCCNPAHLFVGTAADNARDMAEKFRGTNGSTPSAGQKRVLAFIEEYRRDYGSAPSIRELCEAFDVTSTNGMNDHLRALERKGLITRRSMKARSIVVTDIGRGWLTGENAQPAPDADAATPGGAA